MFDKSKTPSSTRRLKNRSGTSNSPTRALPTRSSRDRLRVLLPNDPQNYYRAMDIVPPELRDELGKIKIVITNFHAFRLRERMAAGKLTKSLLTKGDTSPFTETPDQMVRRVRRELGSKKNIVVINDEAHHCCRRKPDDEAEETLKGEERKEAEKREEEARVWLSGLEAVKAKIGVKVAYDLSATPFFLRGWGCAEGTLFPWVVSDFSLIDAIECGIVKAPRVPVADDSMIGEQPTHRDLWLRIREHLPKKGRGTERLEAEPKLPAELEGALQSLYGNYEKYYRLREVMNTVGKPGKLGEGVKCVVSVSILTEGWDANTVTHVLGVRAFGTQLLCEQVVGRGLRRVSYAPNAKGMFEPEYAEV